MNGQLDYQLVP